MNTELSRREFLRTLTMAGTAALLPFAVAADAAPARYLPVGKVADFPLGTFRPVTLPGGDAINVRRLPGKPPKFQALSAKCTHKGCVVAWTPADKQFVCPCHRGRFDATGKNVGGPPPKPLAALPTKVVKGVVLVAV